MPSCFLLYQIFAWLAERLLQLIFEYAVAVLCYRLDVTKYDKETLEKAVRTSRTYSEVLRKIGASITSGGVQFHVRQRIEMLGLDTAHFAKRGENVGNRHRGLCKAIPPKLILIKRTSGKRERTERLRRAMLAIGIQHICAVCSIKTWHDNPLTLEIDHIDGDCLNNERDNVRFLCPNCHSQTKTYCKRK